MAKIRVDRPFVGIPTFLRAPICADLSQLRAAIAVMGVPFDEGSPYLAGSRMAPRALREHSLRFVGAGSKGFYNPETAKQYLEYEMANELIVDAGAPFVEDRVHAAHQGHRRIRRRRRHLGHPHGAGCVVHADDVGKGAAGVDSDPQAGVVGHQGMFPNRRAAFVAVARSGCVLAGNFAQMLVNFQARRFVAFKFTNRFGMIPQ